MQKEYLGTVGNRHKLTKYTLSNGIEVTLNKEELEELYFGSAFDGELQSIQNQNEKLTTQLEYYKGILRDFNSLLKKIGKIK